MSSSTFYNNQSLVGIGSVGIGTTSPLSALHVQGSQYYTGDAVRSAAHLVPNQTNSQAIQNWINFSTSVAIRSWWMTPATAAVDLFNIGSQAGTGGVYSSHGMVIFPPGDGTGIVSFYPETETYLLRITTTIPSGATAGGFAVPGNLIVCNPTYGNVYTINSTLLTDKFVGKIPGGQYSGCLTANNVIFAPQGTPSNVVNFNYATGAYSNVLALPSSNIYGRSWTNPVSAGTGSGMSLALTWNSVTWSPQLGLFVAVASGPTATMNYSTDGKNWSAGAMNTSVNWNSVTWSPQLGLFVAVAGGTATMNYSTDGKNWSAGAMTTSVNWKSVAWSPQLGIFVAIAQSSTIMNYSTGPAQQQGIQLLTNGNVIIPSPSTSNVIQFDPVSLTSSNIFVGTDGFNGLTLAPNGNVIGTPNKSNIIVISPSLGLSSNVTIPSANTNVFTFSLGACLLPSGNIYFPSSIVGFTGTNVGSSNCFTFDPVSLKYSNLSSAGAAGLGFGSAILVPSGKVVLTPTFNGSYVGIYNSQTPVDQTFCASPYFNKS
jgi:hypothetical protein